MSSRRQTVLVIGGGGFLGRSVVSAFLEDGAEVRVLDIVGPDRKDVDWVVGSLFDTSMVASIASGAKIVVFLANASLPGSSHADLSIEVDAHVLTTIRTAEICNDVGVEKFIFASSGGTVYGYSPERDGDLDETGATHPQNAYGVSKLAIEHYLRILSDLREMQSLSLRIANPYGEGQRAVRAQGVIAAAMQHAASGTEMVVWGDGSVERDFVHVDDVARAFVLASKYCGPERVINIGSGHAVSVRDVLAEVERTMKRGLRLRFEPHRRVDVQRNCLSIRRAQTVLGWSPQVSLEEGLRRTAAWWLRSH